MDVILKFDNAQNSIDDDFDDLLGGEEEIESSNWFTTEKINKIKYVHDYLDNNQYIGKVLSLASSIRVAGMIRVSIGLRPAGLPVRRDHSKSPYAVNINVRGIGVAVITSMCALRMPASFPFAASNCR